MKKLFALAIAGSFLLAGCNTVTAPTPAPVEQPTTISKIQSVVVTACGFLPAVSTVANILTASPTVLTATQVAELICKAVTNKAANKVAYAPKVVVVGDKVILINGEFVK